MNFPSGDKLAALRDLITNGRKIEAIKFYREQTGLGLKEAKDAVEAMEEAMRSGAPLPVQQDQEATHRLLLDIKSDLLHELIFAGQKIRAIKFYREEYGVGLKEAKEAVEAIEVILRRDFPHKFQTVQGKGCGAGMLLFCLCLGTALFWTIRG